MNAALVCVDYADLLEVTLPYNRHHFDDVLVITVKDDPCIQIAKRYRCHIHTTDAFYRDGADFNKWLALEEGLNLFGRSGWLCLMDADVLWPTKIEFNSNQGGSFPNRGIRNRVGLIKGKLYVPRRRILSNVTAAIPPESEWSKLSLFNELEFAGYSQIFHCDDPVLGEPPWHETNWRHAGGADSFFQAKWQEQDKIRPAFKVLHLGTPGQNWCGRASQRRDGSTPPEVLVRTDRLVGYLQGRLGKAASVRYEHEKLG